MNKISVSTLVRYLKNKLDTDENLQGVMVGGEISNFHKHNSGHLYFTLKDDKSSISCVMFSSKTNNLRFIPKNGDKVLLSANTSIFEVSGQLQLYVNTMKLDGVGDLYQQYEELKNKLTSEGLFSVEHKKELPFIYPEKIAVLVGDKSAAMSDIKTQFNRRWPLCVVDYYPVLVQGLDAPKDIINKLLEVDNMNYDAIILARGGGSFEDLFCFNDEGLIRCIYNLKTFIVSGLGHEQDFTLTDFVSDLRAPTPTASVELITPNISDVIDEIESLLNLSQTSVNNKIKIIKKDLDLLTASEYLKNPYVIIDNIKLKLDYYNEKLNGIAKLKNTLLIKIDAYLERANHFLNKKIDNNRHGLDKYTQVLDAYSINKTLKRGFSIIYKGDKIVNLSKDLKKDDNITIKMLDGYTNAIIKED